MKQPKVTIEQEIILTKFINIRNQLSVNDMFLLYNTLNHMVNKECEYEPDDIKPYKKLAKKIRGMLVK